MNAMFDIGYLAGGSQYWGPNKGEVIVNTVVRKGYGWQCRNVGQLLENFTFETAEQSLGMKYVMNDGMKDVAAGKKLIRKNPELLDRWFGRSGNYRTGGVMTASGDERAHAVIAEALEM
jgi:glycine betaine/proline transport system substrate-binding protein